jgi:hypothetical protein
MLKNIHMVMSVNDEQMWEEMVMVYFKGLPPSICFGRIRRGGTQDS